MKNIIVILLTVISLGCNTQDKMKDTPLMSVIKLQSAEALMNFEEAKKYIDLQKVFEENPESQDVEKEWKEMLTFFYNIGNDKKFANQFKYFNYNITETINNSKAKVSFVSINQTARMKEIIYHLDKFGDKWKVVEIQYIN